MSVNVIDPDKPRLAILQGGKGTTNWLWHLPLSTVFLTREQGTKRFELVMFQLVEKSEGNVRLIVPSYSGPPQSIWVDPTIFSSTMEQIEILALGKEDVSDNDGSSQDSSSI